MSLIIETIAVRDKTENSFFLEGGARVKICFNIFSFAQISRIYEAWTLSKTMIT